MVSDPGFPLCILCQCFTKIELLTEFSDDNAENDAECAHKLQGSDVSLQVELRMRECHVKLALF